MGLGDTAPTAATSGTAFDGNATYLPSSAVAHGRTGDTAVAPAAIGPYHLLQPLGEGGMGVVYLAEQREPIHRRVALKLIKPGMDTREVLARFEAERQTLALMDHPNIARVLDAGATADHRPYFVMEYAPGVPITEYCDQHHANAHDRLALFLDVCAAVQHAHQKGIIHRDLKPSNVLVTEMDGRPIPKVIDFGIAKATAQQQAEATMFTQLGMLVGTPEYMSPEQADPGVVDIDTRTDIYSLGVILYELLTGALPFDTETLRRAGLFEMHRVIREQNPPKPSTRVATMMASGQRRTPTTVSSELKGDLDWITLKALEKDRDRRYGSASELAADIERHLRHEPVLAGPATAWYRTQKFVRKHRSGVAAAAALFICVLAGLATSTALYFNAERQRAEADLQRGRAEQQRHEADAQRTLADRQRAAAEAGRREATAQRGIAETRRAEADAARHDMAIAYDRERIARTRADTERDEADRQRREAEWEAYVATISGADLDLRAGEIAEAITRLNRVRADSRGWEWRHLSYRADSSLKTFELAGQSPMLNVHWSSFAFDGTGVFWNTQTTLHSWDARATVPPETWGIFGSVLAFAPTGTLLATQNLPPWLQVGFGSTRSQPGSIDEAHHVFSVIDASNGRTVRTLTGHRAPVWCASFGPNGTRLASASQDGTLRVWDVQSGRTVALINTTAGWPCVVAFSPDGGRLVFSAAGEVTVWNASNGSPVATLSGQHGGVRGIAVSPDGTSVATGSWDKTVRLFDVSTGAMRRSFMGHTGEVASVAFSPDGRHLVSGGYDKTVRIWNIDSGQEEAVLSGHPVAEVNSVAFDPTGERVLAGSTTSDRGWIRIWNAAGNGSGAVLQHTGLLTSVAFSADNGRIAVGSEDGSIQIWDPHTFKRIFTLKGHEGPVRTVAFDPRGGRLVSGSADKSIRIWDLASGKVLATLAGHRERVNSVAVSPSGKEIASASDDRTVRVFDAASGTILAAWEGTEPVNIVAFTGNGATVLFGAGDATADTDSMGRGHMRTTGLWNWQSRTPPALVDGLSGASVTSMAVSPDERVVILAGQRRDPVVWDAHLGSGLGPFRRVENAPAEKVTASARVFVGGNPGVSWDGPQSIAFSPDGTRVAYTSERTVRVWDVGTRRLVLTLRHEKEVHGVAFSPDGSLLAVIQEFGIRLWQAVPASKGGAAQSPSR
jgi:WD40 repeat protein